MRLRQMTAGHEAWIAPKRVTWPNVRNVNQAATQTLQLEITTWVGRRRWPRIPEPTPPRQLQLCNIWPSLFETKRTPIEITSASHINPARPDPFSFGTSRHGGEHFRVPWFYSRLPAHAYCIKWILAELAFVIARRETMANDRKQIPIATSLSSHKFTLKWPIDDIAHASFKKTYTRHVNMCRKHSGGWVWQN